MPRREIIFEEIVPYHILSRAIERVGIFEREEDCYRFIFQTYAANRGRPAHNIRREEVIIAAQKLLRGQEISPKIIIVRHEPLVHILSFVLVGNHYHFKLVQNVRDGIPKYMHKLNMGFARYFNLKHNRKDALFRKRYDAIPIKTDFQSAAVLRYINIINPLDVYQPGWRTRGLQDKETAFDFLNDYQFSSFPDLFCNRHSKILAPREILRKFLGEEFLESKQEYINFVKDYLDDNLKDFSSLFLEEHDKRKEGRGYNANTPGF